MPAPNPASERTASSDEVRIKISGCSACADHTVLSTLSMRSASSTICGWAAHSARLSSGWSASGWLEAIQTRLGERVSTSTTSALGSPSALEIMMARSTSPLISKCSKNWGESSTTDTLTEGCERLKRANKAAR